MDDKIVNIYDLDNLKTDCNYFTIKITFENDKIYSLEIDGESHNKNKIIIIPSSKILFLNLYDIIEDYGYDYMLVGIKFKIHNINTPIGYRTYKKSEKSIYDGQIIIDDIQEKFQIDLIKGEKISGSVQINIYELMRSKISHHDNFRNYSQFYMEPFDISSNFYCLKLLTSYLKIFKHNVKLDIPGKINKCIRKYEIPFVEKNMEGTIQLECYINCSRYIYYVISRIAYNGAIIDTIQNNKCDCSEYATLDYIKTDNKFTNRIKSCWCFLDKVYRIFGELKLYCIFIKKEDLIKSLNLKNNIENLNIIRYFKT